MTASIVAAGAQQAPADEFDAAAMYRLACAACHGVDGSGLEAESPIYQSFKRPPADLSDALFNSREPVADCTS